MSSTETESTTGKTTSAKTATGKTATGRATAGGDMSPGPDPDMVTSLPPQQRGDQVAQAPVETNVVSMPAAANGVPTSVFGFAVVITMLSLANAGVLDSGTIFVPIALVLGFFTIGIGGLYELRNTDLFGGTFGVVYASFLLTTGVILRFFAPAADADAATAGAFGDEVGSFFLLFALISFIFAFAGRLVNLTAVLAFAGLGGVLLLAGLANIVGGDTATTLTKLAGYVGLLDGVAAFWLATGILLNTMHGKDMMPLGAPKG